MQENAVSALDQGSLPKLRLWQQDDSGADSKLPRLTVGQLLAGIQDEVARLRTPPLSADLLTAPTVLPASAPEVPARVDWTRVSDGIDQLEKDARTIGMAPSLPGGNALKRGIKAFLAKLVLGLTRFITARQREFNLTTLTALRDLVTTLRHLEQVEACRHQRLEERVSRSLRCLQEVAEEVYRFRTQVLGQERRLGLLLEEARRRLPAPFTAEQLGRLAEEDGYTLDGLNDAFADEWNGTCEEVKARLRSLLPLLGGAGIGTRERPVLDLAAGRGEWLQLLAERGWQAEGFETSQVGLEQCRQHGLKVTAGEALVTLHSLPASSVGAVTAFHLIERLTLLDVIRLLDEVARVLKPGGVLLLESSNPENMLAATGRFTLDARRHRPVFPETLRFLAEQRGLLQVEVVRVARRPAAAASLEPLPDDHFLAARINPLVHVLRQCLGAAENYVLVARTLV